MEGYKLQPIPSDYPISYLGQSKIWCSLLSLYLKFETEKLPYLATGSVDIRVEDLLNTLS